MKQTTINFHVDALAFAAFVFLTATGVLVRYVLPPGSGRHSTLWGMDRHGWGTIHFWVAIVFLGTLAIHLILHWRWVVCVVKGRPREGSGGRVALAMVGLIGLVGLTAAPFFSSIESVGRPEQVTRPSELGPALDYRIEGSMTLREVEELTGVAVTDILRDLNLPPDVPSDERLGRLRRMYGIEIDDVRQIVEERARQRP